MTLRRAGPGDLPALLVVERLAPTGRWSPASLADDLARPDRRWLLAERDGSAVAAAGVAGLAGDAHVLSVAVAPDHRRRGLATALVGELLRVAGAELGCSRATLEVRVSNGPARRLYRHLGFTEVGHRPGYYPDGEDAVILWCDDPTSCVPPSATSSTSFTSTATEPTS